MNGNLRRSQKEVWIGLAEVVPRKGQKVLNPRAKGAMVNAMAWVSSKRQFRVRVQGALKKLGLKLVRIEEVEPFRQRQKGRTFDRVVNRMKSRVKTGKSEVAFGTFHTWSNGDS
jgi:hypothetical protein